MTDKPEKVSPEDALNHGLSILIDAEIHVLDTVRACKVMREFVDSDEVTDPHCREAAVWLAMELEGRAIKTRQVYEKVFEALRAGRAQP
jgi:hypothetical protein